MGALLLALLLALPATLLAQDTIPYADSATRVLVARAMARHQAQDSAVNDYRARLRYRLTVSVGRRRWGRSPAVGVEEQEARVQWQRPNDLRVDVIGRRFKGRVEGMQLSSVFDHPWFVPYTVDDSVRIISNDLPATGALHPLAAGADRHYRYAQVDSTTVQRPDGHKLKLLAVEVRPREVEPALVAGRLWLDSASGEVVRFAFRYVGTGLWVRPGQEGRDSASARRLNRLVNRVLSLEADLEYSIQEGKLWMPYRQTVSGRIEVPIVSDLVIPFRAVTTFRDYEINTGDSIAFALPMPDSGVTTVQRRAREDSLASERRAETRRDSTRSWDYAGRWPGGRYELHRPANDSLSRYRGWRDTLSLRDGGDERARATEASLAALSEELPGELTGRQAYGIGFERVSDVFQYNRVQGVSLGLGLRARAPGRFNDVFVTGRYGFSDRRVTGRLSLVRDAPEGQFTLSGYRDIADVDPFSSGRTLANSVNALFVAHDEADYLLGTGAVASYEAALSDGLDVRVALFGERERSVLRRARSRVNELLGGDGLFGNVTPVREGTYGGATVGLEGYGPFHWGFGADALTGSGQTGARAYGTVRKGVGGTRGATVRLQAGIGTNDSLPQLAFRAGGQHSVRGFDYATQLGRGFWSAQLDVSPIGGSFRPVFFIDAGRAAAPRDLLSGRVLVGGGVGLSVFSRLLRTSLLRFDFSHAISPSGGKWRFDLVFQASR